MSEVLNVQDECDILDILVKKIITNLKCWGDDDMILVRKNIFKIFWKFQTIPKNSKKFQKIF